MRLRSTDGAAPKHDGPFQDAGDHLLGDLLVRAGALSTVQIDKILKRQLETEGKFGETAVELGLVDNSTIRTILDHQTELSELTASELSVDRRVLMACDSAAPFAVHLRSFIQNLKAVVASDGHAPNIFTVGCVEAASEAALIVGNLAVLSARAGQRTLIVDANIEHPAHNYLFRTDNEKGLVNLMGTRESPRDLVQSTPITRLSVLPTGPRSLTTSSLFDREQLIHRLAPLTEGFDMVFVDGSTLIAPQLAKASIGASGTIVVVRERRSSMRDLRKLSNLLEHNKLPPPGIIILD